MSSTTEILNKLNEWDSVTDDDDLADIWRDLIHTHDSYDAEATAALPSGGLFAFALKDGTVIRWDAEDICWRVQS